jgi:hypothetical protein
MLVRVILFPCLGLLALADLCHDKAGKSLKSSAHIVVADIGSVVDCKEPVSQEGASSLLDVTSVFFSPECHFRLLLSSSV